MPPIDDYDIRKGRTYLYFNDAPLYPFGYGLSYTTFAYGKIQLNPSSVAASGATTVTIDVSNSGTRAGDELVQLYTYDVSSATQRPYKQPRRFQRVHLEPGASKSITFQLSARDLAHWDISTHGWRTDPGIFDVYVGASAADVRARGVLTVSP